MSQGTLTIKHSVIADSKAAAGGSNGVFAGSSGSKIPGLGGGGGGGFGGKGGGNGGASGEFKNRGYSGVGGKGGDGAGLDGSAAFGGKEDPTSIYAGKGGAAQGGSGGIARANNGLDLLSGGDGGTAGVVGSFSIGGGGGAASQLTDGLKGGDAAGALYIASSAMVYLSDTIVRNNLGAGGGGSGNKSYDSHGIPKPGGSGGAGVGGILRACYELPTPASTRAAAGNMSTAKTRKCSPPSTSGRRS